MTTIFAQEVQYQHMSQCLCCSALSETGLGSSGVHWASFRLYTDIAGGPTVETAFPPCLA